MTSIYVVIGIIFAAAAAFANPGFRLWFTAQKFKLRRQLGWASLPTASTGAAAMHAKRLPGDNAAVDADAEAEAELAWRARRASQSKAGRAGAAKPGRAAREGGSKGARKPKR